MVTATPARHPFARPALPKLSPTVVERLRIDDWLTRHAAVPLRFLAASPGSGKTTALASYLARTQKRAIYLEVRAGEKPRELRSRMAHALGMQANLDAYAGLLAMLAICAPCEIVVDGLDNGTQELRDELSALVEDAPSGISLLYAAQSRSTIGLGRNLVRGIAVLLDGDALAFDADETERLAEAHGVPQTAADVDLILEETEGWAVVVDGVLRSASERSASLAGAFDAWRVTRGRHMAAFIEAELRKAALGDLLPDELLAFLEARGLFVRYDAHGILRPYRVASQLGIAAFPNPAHGFEVQPVTKLVARVFGRLEARIGERAIEWVRRRDRQLFAYVLLKRDGTATRKELRDVFWPDSDEQLAMQSIRTSCCNIRKALAAIVGVDGVEQYFPGGPDVTVDLTHVTLDARRFGAHVANGDADAASGNLSGALAQYRAAEKLYAGDFLAGEAPEAWHETHATAYKALYARAAQQISELRPHGRAR